MDVKALKTELSEIEKEIATLSAILKTLPPGSLKISGSEKSVKFCHATGRGKNRKVTYIRKENLQLSKKLAQKRYYQNLLVVLKERQQAILNFLDKYVKTEPTDVFEGLTDIRKELVTPYYLTDSQFAKQWSEKDYVKSTLYVEKRILHTKKGDLVRSKSEVMIANLLFSMNIPYRYEAELKIGKNYSFYPDFTILNKRTRKVLYLEHFGMLDNGQYLSNALKKIEIYNSAGIILGDNLILSFESSTCPFDLLQIEAVIKRTCL